MTKSKIVLISATVVCCIVLVLILTFGKEVPGSEIDEARKKLSEAQYLRSSMYAPYQFQMARDYYDSTMISWQQQNSRIILFRRYNKIGEYARLSSKFSDDAIKITTEKISSTQDMLDRRISILEQKEVEFENKYAKLPLSGHDRRKLAKSKLLLHEAQKAYTQGSFQTCKSKLDSTEIIINRLYSIYLELLENYLSEYPQWAEWIHETITVSRTQKSYCLIIDKWARNCTLYHKGKAVQSFGIELGSNWIGDKNQEGDKTTPEGMYTIISKKMNGETKYYKAFLLNYPNEDDQKRFAANKKNGKLSVDAQIGGLIEIHGGGGSGIDWTDGCIALENQNMEKLFSVCPVGTKVTIVGSGKPLSELFSEIQ